MASNSFGNIFRFTTWGESHGPAIGVVIDGCPAGLELDEDMINADLARRAPGSSPYTTPRAEKDRASIHSGLFQGKTTGAPLSIIIQNGNADSSKYAAIAKLLRPGHANYTYLQKYGVFDYRGGGRASARETAGRVAAGAVARALLRPHGIEAGAFLSAVGEYSAAACSFGDALAYSVKSSVFAPDQAAEENMIKTISEAREQGDSVGGVVTFFASGLPSGLGDPVYGKLEAMLALAMLGIPASKGFEIGEGFASAKKRGSDFNDQFLPGGGGKVEFASNQAGGVLGGISTGEPLYGRVAFKPTPSIFKSQQSVDIDGNKAEFKLPEGSRHDPCVALRAVPVIEAMCLVVLADALLMNRGSRI